MEETDMDTNENTSPTVLCGPKCAYWRNFYCTVRAMLVLRPTMRPCKYHVPAVKRTKPFPRPKGNHHP